MLTGTLRRPHSGCSRREMNFPGEFNWEGLVLFPIPWNQKATLNLYFVAFS
jgi:hypothetical protein